MPEAEQIRAIKDTLLANLDAQLAHVRFRFGCNLVLQADSIEHELMGVKSVLEKITALHKVAQALRTLRQNGINLPLRD